MGSMFFTHGESKFYCKTENEGKQLKPDQLFHNNNMV